MSSKKQDFIRNAQNRDKHPESEMKGSAASVAKDAQSHSVRGTASADRQAPHSGKSSNDHNKMGETHPKQTNQGRRTPESRHDRQTAIGGMNVTQARTGGKGGGRGSRGGNVGGSSS